MSTQIEQGTELEDDSHSDLAAAWEQHEAEDDDSIDQYAVEAGDTQEPEGDRTAETGAEPDADASGIPGEGEQGVQPAAAESHEKPPVGLSPEARESWAETPPAIRAEIAKREKDFANGIRQYAEAAKRDQQMVGAMRPFAQYIAMNGNNPVQTIQGLLQTASQLQMGSPQQSAEAVAGLISQFNIDIGLLDSMLVGETPQVSPQDQIQQAVNNAVAPYIQEQEQRRQQESYQAQTSIQNELQQFASQNEFYNDVRGDMANILDAYAAQGTKLTMDQAYNIACSARPDIAQIIQGRQSTQQIAAKRSASVSVSGSPGGPGGNAEPTSQRAALEQAWDNYGRV